MWHPILDKQIKELRHRVNGRSSKEKELYSLLVSDAVTKDFVLDAVTEVKRMKAEEAKQLDRPKRKRSEVSRPSSFSASLTVGIENKDLGPGVIQHVSQLPRWKAGIKRHQDRSNP